MKLDVANIEVEQVKTTQEAETRDGLNEGVYKSIADQVHRTYSVGDNTTIFLSSSRKASLQRIRSIILSKFEFQFYLVHYFVVLTVTCRYNFCSMN